MSDQAPDLGAMVSKLLGNPELISQIASTVGVDVPKAEEKSEKTAEPASVPPLGAILPMLSSSGGPAGSSKRCALLAALKPFCNEHRCRTIDYMIGISKLSENLIPTKRG